MNLLKKRPKIKLPSVREFQILNLLWSQSPLSVSDVREGLSTDVILAYTTVMTILDLMFKKGLVKREKQGKRYYYEAVFSKNDILENLTLGFIENYFNGNHRELLELIFRVYDNGEYNSFREGLQRGLIQTQSSEKAEIKDTFAWNEDEEDYLL